MATHPTIVGLVVSALRSQSGAVEFWGTAAAHALTSEGFKAIAAKNLQTLQAL
ncbi:hypothetical protein [Polaromonas sp. YR568]|uniref:hypothetical protein n=1 Tax=Polaromonas sp. YR568 TaxID=1855301 RepID=UPI00398BEB01